ncbi:MAG: MGMT family protein [Candidatus Eremiobacteraeota bacterium]|nr:MGMT family protein [Candidatus Eremiobacteraeota bacterium]MCW5866303.1 MGMT family protein [Candidatus Eremiobacteraeota bacterium]
MNFADRVLDIIRAVPPGQVVTYGQVAALAGYPRRARHVGHALRDCPQDVPWHRVLGAGGSVRVDPPQRQLELLRGEGVVTQSGRISLKKYQWQPGPLSFL